MQFAAFSHHEFTAMTKRCETEIFLGPFHYFILLKINLIILFVCEQLDSCIDENGTKDIENPVEVADNYCAQSDEQPTKDNRPQYAPKQHSVEIYIFQFEVAE